MAVRGLRTDLIAKMNRSLNDSIDQLEDASRLEDVHLALITSILAGLADQEAIEVGRKALSARLSL